jgi:hypothetical protein
MLDHMVVHLNHRVALEDSAVHHQLRNGQVRHHNVACLRHRHRRVVVCLPRHHRDEGVRTKSTMVRYVM